eukprot:75335-Ditylum_brightwellii.AAC.1
MDKKAPASQSHSEYSLAPDEQAESALAEALEKREHSLQSRSGSQDKRDGGISPDMLPQTADHFSAGHHRSPPGLPRKNTHDGQMRVGAGQNPTRHRRMNTYDCGHKQRRTLYDAAMLTKQKSVANMR